MYKIYLLSTPAYHEKEEMKFTYAIYDEEKFIRRKETFFEYRKPILTGLYAVMDLLKDIKDLRKYEVTIIVNDGALVEQINGTTTTKNDDVLKVAALARRHMNKFNDSIDIISVAGDYEAMVNWENKLNETTDIG